MTNNNRELHDDLHVAFDRVYLHVARPSHTPGALFNSYGGLDTDHPILQKLIQKAEPDFPSIQLDLSLVVNQLEKGMTENETASFLYEQTALDDATDKQPIARFLGNLKNRFLNSIYRFTEHGRTLLDHARFITDCAREIRADFRQTQRVCLDCPYYGLTTDHPCLQQIVINHAPNEPNLQKALSLAVNGAHAYYPPNQTLRDLDKYRTDVSIAKDTQRPGHPVTPISRILQKSESPRLVSTPNIIKRLPDNQTLLNTAKSILEKFHQQYEFQTRYEEGLSTSDTNHIGEAPAKAHAPEPGHAHQQTIEQETQHQHVQRLREKFRGFGRGR